MRRSSSSDLDRGRRDPSQRMALAGFARNDLVPSVVHGAAATEGWVTGRIAATNARPQASGVAAARPAPVEVAKEAGVG